MMQTFGVRQIEGEGVAVFHVAESFSRKWQDISLFFCFQRFLKNEYSKFVFQPPFRYNL